MKQPSNSETVKKLQEHLKEPPESWLKRIGDIYQIDSSSLVEEAIRICGIRRKLKEILKREWIEITRLKPIPDPELEILPILRRFEEFTHFVKPQSIMHLKQLCGVPNSAFLRARALNPCHCPPHEIQSHLLPNDRIVDLSRLEAAQRLAVKQLAENLLYGYADEEEMTKNPQLAAAGNFALSRAEILPIFAAKNLIVCDGEKVVFSGFASLLFHNVIIEGSGEINLGNYSKLVAYNIIRV